ncbi:hypothetical protein N7931_01530 [Catenovulum sp. 2E275]|uniref:hypothetical protein n=1 Tax=Catenovulum sp. 2E275 TaxID=2980497 RepID=UPI0021D2BBA2|nr:hypothetical protein [Catenovulum sp. 2E275]MCU4674300.1 hypothetical protein [Catenovulum sp. 2E275]
MNIFDVVNTKIIEFVSRSENHNLQRGTGSYSVPFRGSLFETTNTTKVLTELENQAVEVIWLGSNPNVPGSLQAILDSALPTHFNGFLDQQLNNNFSEAYADKSGVLHPCWDPINKPNNKWQFYTEVLNKKFGAHKTLMANIVPWGSKNFKAFTGELKKLDADLLARALSFSYELNNLIIEYFKPKVILVPKSINSSTSTEWCLHPSKLMQIRHYQVKGKVAFIFSVGLVEVDGTLIKVVTAPHPSYTPRIGKEYREIAQQALFEQL